MQATRGQFILSGGFNPHPLQKKPAQQAVPATFLTLKICNTNIQNMKTAVSKNQYVYYRKEGFYTIEDWNDEQAIKAVEKNPGTIKVDKVVKGKLVTIWPVKK